MKKTLLSLLFCLVATLAAEAQGVKRVYDEGIDPMVQIDEALSTAGTSGRYVICQVGGNWCKWCLLFADFITKDEEIAQTVADNFVYIHVNLPERDREPLLARLGHPQRFGYPALVVLDAKGHVVHIQDSSFLEDGDGYDRKRVMRFFTKWTPAAVEGTK